MTGSWTMDVFIIGAVVLILYPLIVFVVRERRKG